MPGNPVAGGNVLRRPALASPGFVSGSTGWSINADGTAEFNSLVIRGGTIISGVYLVYSGAPAFGALVASIAAFAGTDSSGNAYLAGVTDYQPGANPVAVNLNSGIVTIYTAADESGPWTAQTQLLWSTSGSYTDLFGGSSGGEIILGSGLQTVTSVGAVSMTFAYSAGFPVVTYVGDTSDATNSAGITAEAVTDTLNWTSVIGAKYRVAWECQWLSTVTTDQALARLRVTNLTGTQLNGARTANANNTGGRVQGLFTATGVSSTVVGTGQRVGTGTLTRVGSATGPSVMTVERIG